MTKYQNLAKADENSPGYTGSVKQMNCVKTGQIVKAGGIGEI